MKYQERIQVLKAEVRTYIWMPFIMTGIIAPFLTVIIWKLRQYTQADCISYMKVWGILAAGYLVIQVVGMKIIELYIVRKVEGKYDTCPGKFKKS